MGRVSSSSSRASSSVKSIRHGRTNLLLLSAAPAASAALNRGHGVPQGTGGADIILRERGPLGARDAVEVVDHPAVAERQLRGPALIAIHTGAVVVGEAELALLEPEHGNIGGRAHRQVA